MEANEQTRYCPLCGETSLLDSETYCPDCIKILNKMYPDGWENLDSDFVKEDYQCNGYMYYEEDEAPSETADTYSLSDPEEVREKQLLRAFISLAAGAAIFLLLIFWLTDFGKYWLTGKNIQFKLVDSVTKTYDNERETTEYYEGTVKGKTVFYKCYVTYGSLDDDAAAYTTSELDSKGRLKMYRDIHGNWLPAERMDIGDLLLCSVVPLALIAYGAYSLSVLLKKKKKE